MNEKIELYAKAIKEASIAAELAFNPDDGGTCNLDSVVIDFSGWNRKSIAKVSELSGVEISEKLTSLYKGFCFVSIPLHGQANTRTRMAEAANRKLRELGIPSSIYYHMD